MTARFRRSWLAGITSTALLASSLSLLAAPAAADPSDTESLPPAHSSAVDEAVRTGQPVTIDELTTETREVKANPDGSFTADQTRLPTRTKRDGTWVPVDTTLTANSDGTISPAASVLPMAFSGGGDQPMIQVGTPDQRFTIDWSGSLPEPALNGNQATYADVMPGVDLVITAEADSFRHVLVVNTPEAARNPALTALTYPMTATGLSIDQTGDAITITDSDQNTVLRSTQPYMWDSTTNPAIGDAPSAADPGTGLQTAIPMSSVQARGPAAIRLTPPVEALTGPDVSYPVYIDPAFEKVAVNWLTVTSSGVKWWNSSTESFMRVGYCNWADCNGIGVARSYFNIDTSTFAGPVTTGKVYSAALYVTQVHNATCSATPVDLYSANSISSSTSWPGPAVAKLQQLSSGAGVNCSTKSATLQFNNASVVAKLQEAVNGKWGHTTFGLRAPNENDANQWKKFDKNPKLSVTYGFPPSPASGLTVVGAKTCNGTLWAPNNNNVEFRATGTDNNPSSGDMLRLIFKVYKGTTVVASSTADPVKVTSGVPGSWSASLPNGDYTLKVTVWSGYGPDRVLVSATDTALNFSVSRTAPSSAGTITSHDYPGPNILGTPQGQGGKILLTAPSGQGVVGFIYRWNDNTWPDAACATTSTTALSGVVLATGGQITITVPPALVHQNTIQVRTFNVALSTSATGSYSIHIPVPVDGASTTTRIEAETASITQPAGQNLLIGTEGPSSIWSENHARHIYFTGPDQQIRIPLTTTVEADYALGLKVRTGHHNGKFDIAINGHIIAAGVDTYSSQDQLTYLNLNGVRLTAGTHTLTITTVNPNPNSANHNEQGIDDNGNALVLDYIRLIPAPPA